jgi:hypothetical protein
MPIPHTTMVGKSNITTFTYIPMMMHDDEDYVITVDGYTDEHEEKIERFYLTKEKYNCLSVGQYFNVDKDCSDQPNEDKKLYEVK